MRSGVDADVAQLVAHHLAKVRVASSNLVIRSGGPGNRNTRDPLPYRWRGREARQRPAKPCTRVRIPSPPLTTEHSITFWAIGAVG